MKASRPPVPFSSSCSHAASTAAPAAFFSTACRRSIPGSNATKATRLCGREIHRFEYPSIGEAEKTGASVAFDHPAGAERPQRISQIFLEPVLPDNIVAAMWPLRQFGFMILIALFWYVDPFQEAFWTSMFRTMFSIGVDPSLALLGLQTLRFW